MDSNTQKRKRLKIKQRFQDSFLMEMLLVLFIAINVLLGVVLRFGTSDDPFELSIYVATVIGGVELIGLGVVFWYLLRSSHRIAGPVYALEQALEKLGKGDLTQALSFRKKDHFHETGDLFNQTVAGLRSEIEQLRGQAELLNQVVEPGTPAADASEQLLERLDRFKL